MVETQTDRITEQRVINKLKSLGLVAYEPLSGWGVDIITHPPGTQFKIVKIKFIGRNPVHDSNLRCFK
jgi:hypothetical protein